MTKFLGSNGLTYLWSKIKAAFVSGVSISGNNLRITKNGSNTDLTVPYADSTKKIIKSNTIGSNGDVNTVDSTDGIVYYDVYHTATNKFDTSNNANVIVDIHTNSTGKYNHQIGFSSNGEIYHRYRNNGSWSVWKKNINETNIIGYTGGYIGYSTTGYLVTHPEATNGIVVPYLYNDIAFLRSQGGSVSIYSTTSTDLTAETLTVKTNWNDLSDIDYMFDASPRYFNAGNGNAAEMNADGLIIDITLPRVFTYGNVFYIDFGHSDWGFNNVDIFVRNSNTETSYVNKISGGLVNYKSEYYVKIQHSSTNSSGTTVSGFNQIRLHLYGRTSGGGVRIAQIGLINFTSQGHRYTMMSRGIDDGVWRNISPYISGGYTLGTSSKRWSNIYTNYGNFANAITASSTITATGAITGGSFIKSGGTSSQFLKADGSVDSTSYASKTEVNNALNTKQNTLTFDTIPTNESDNPVTSNGIKSYVDNIFYGKNVFREFTFDTAGGSDDICTGSALIKKMRGNTIVWNQLAKALNNSNWGISAQLTVTYTNNVARVTTNIDNAENWQNRFRQIENTNNIKDHKLYLAATVTPSVSCNVSIWSYGKDEDGVTQGNALGYTFVNLSENVKKRVSAILDMSIRTKAISCYPAISFWGDELPANSYMDIQDFVFFDLTKMFGAGNEPSTVEEFEKLFPMPYYDYNEGQLLSFNGNSIKTVGFNQWDEEWVNGVIDSVTGAVTISPASKTFISKNFIPILPNTAYYNYVSSVQMNFRTRFYDADKNYIGYVQKDGTFCRMNNVFITPENAHYLLFEIQEEYGGVYKNDICINLSWSGTKNGTYEPYQEHVHDISFYKSIKDGDGNLLFPNGLLSAGSVYDEVTATKAIKRVGVVDLGTLNWVKRANAEGVFQTDSFNYAYSETPNIICERYSAGQTVTAGDLLSSLPDKQMYIYQAAGVSSKMLYIHDTSYTDAATFKAAMQGVMLYYELAEPIEVDFEEQNMAYQVNDYGTEQLLPENTSVPTTTPIMLDVTYGNIPNTIVNINNTTYSKTEVDNALNTKQASLVSGTNIKTVNNQSLLGSGNISIAVYPIVNQTASSVSISPGVLNVWGTMSSLTITFATPSDSSIMNEYLIQFTSGTTATTLSLPSSIKWADAPDIEANATYQISVVNNLGIIVKFT